MLGESRKAEAAPQNSPSGGLRFREEGDTRPAAPDLRLVTFACPPLPVCLSARGGEPGTLNGSAATLIPRPYGACNVLSDPASPPAPQDPEISPPASLEGTRLRPRPRVYGVACREHRGQCARMPAGVAGVRCTHTRESARSVWKRSFRARLADPRMRSASAECPRPPSESPWRRARLRARLAQLSACGGGALGVRNLVSSLRPCSLPRTVPASAGSGTGASARESPVPAPARSAVPPNNSTTSGEAALPQNLHP